MTNNSFQRYPFLDFSALKRKCKKNAKDFLLKIQTHVNVNLWLIIACKIDKEKNLYKKMYHETRVQPCLFWHFFQFLNNSKFSAPIISKRQRKNMFDGQINLLFSCSEIKEYLI